ncbi:F-box only protein 33 [Temnothorax curvispinosus]|uniref:F-box only protein 33 n=1 Tax=Temnothorax curvispinosus TaxID=300111 RepID=A0A6J1PM12_9HYME|nr:F-box only protein 33 [Temnothorax curvispinosus]
MYIYMPVSAVNGAPVAALGDSDRSNGATDGSRYRPIGWLDMMRACDDTSDVRLETLERFRAATATAASGAVATASGNGDADTTAEEATSRKCEGQLSMLCAANSCSSCKPACRTSEMAQKDHGSSWANLPTVILQEIFTYLSHDTRIRASQVCKNWRCTLFHPNFWKKITFVFRDQDSVVWARFLANRFALSVHEATIRWDIPRYVNCIGETYRLLKKLGQNRQLRKLFLEFNSNTYDLSFDNEDDSNYKSSASLVKCVVNIIETSNCLETLSLGCREELIMNLSTILEPLRLHHAKHLTHLSLASIKDDPDYYDFFELDNSIFNSFIRLSILTLDYEYVSDTLLEALDNGCMQRLVIHIHGWKEDYPGTTNMAWQMFVQKNPQCELRLNLIHSYAGVKVLDTDIFCPAMPLTHLQVLFCENINIRALHRLSMWYAHTLKSLTWIDSIDRKQHMPSTFDSNDPTSPDSLVLVAWKCTKLTKMVFLGHKYYQENLLAIARLRGSTLKLLVFAKSDITSDFELWRHNQAESIRHEIRDIMGPHWMPLDDSDLPMVILNPFKGDSREVIMPLVLSDQK